MSALILPPTDASVQLVAQALVRGELCVIPTDTVYGVAAAVAAEPVRRLYRAKGRPESRPIPVLLAGLDEVGQVAAQWPPAAAAIAACFWPGALTLVLPARHWLPVEVTGGTGTVGLRWPAGRLVQQVIRMAGGMLAVTSANRSGELPATTAEQALEALGGLVTYVLDGGDLAGNRASTVVAIRAGEVQVLREGPIERSEIEAVVGSRRPVDHS
ncbi:MAG: threonylcarbamoyl-AMP synthase [Anaerolineae bacterium]|nr:threonylcarbamoyl-AMP synthase [Anaerolineae bacterium]